MTRSLSAGSPGSSRIHPGAAARDIDILSSSAASALRRLPVGGRLDSPMMETTFATSEKEWPGAEEARRAAGVFAQMAVSAAAMAARPPAAGAGEGAAGRWSNRSPLASGECTRASRALAIRQAKLRWAASLVPGRRNRPGPGEAAVLRQGLAGGGAPPSIASAVRPFTGSGSWHDAHGAP